MNPNMNTNAHSAAHTSQFLPGAFFFFATLFMLLDGLAIQGLWMASLKALPIAILAMMAMRHLEGLSRSLTLAALAFSALGDVLLEMTFAQQFIFGLGAFLVAQLLYAANFLRFADFRNRRSLIRILPVILVAVGLARWILPAAGELAPAVLLYLLAIVAMALGAGAHRGNSGLLFAGALTFMLSDALIAVNKFIAPLPLADTAIMLTYYGAQVVILYGIRRAQA
ncbi:lysoplasmalogenase [Microbulbifer sp. THAF38]|uniref:lysoplasmalogenase n=1 Tax=Microbulbifer sp. THAF38 TaxID=2587856 RepID=UPI0012AA0B55|nr:lysoplasmalogenase [Microbulbifer sp. THAF38]QFT56799.1 YhhN-like protein [Microbulbifer sp. THAF38]